MSNVHLNKLGAAALCECSQPVRGSHGSTWPTRRAAFSIQQATRQAGLLRVVLLMLICWRAAAARRGGVAAWLACGRGIQDESTRPTTREDVAFESCMPAARISARSHSEASLDFASFASRNASLSPSVVQRHCASARPMIQSFAQSSSPR